MAYVMGIVDESRMDELSRHLTQRGLGDRYTVIDGRFIGEERLLAAPVTGPFQEHMAAPGVVMEPAGRLTPVGLTAHSQVADLDEQLSPFNLDDEEEEFYTRQIAEGATFVAVEVDEEQMDEVQRLLEAVDAQQIAY